jgi:hypothetical protein
MKRTVKLVGGPLDGREKEIKKKDSEYFACPVRLNSYHKTIILKYDIDGKFAGWFDIEKNKEIGKQLSTRRTRRFETNIHKGFNGHFADAVFSTPYH